MIEKKMNRKGAKGAEDLLFISVFSAPLRFFPGGRR
jgi:hypothetical protein